MLEQQTKNSLWQAEARLNQIVITTDEIKDAITLYSNHFNSTDQDVCFSVLKKIEASDKFIWEDDVCTALRNYRANTSNTINDAVTIVLEKQIKKSRIEDEIRQYKQILRDLEKLGGWF